MDQSQNKPVLKIHGVDGNAFVILGIASEVAEKNNMDWDTICAEAMNGDYKQLLRTMRKYFNVK